MSSRRTVSLVTPVCARNEGGSEELAGHPAVGGGELVGSAHGERASVAVTEAMSDVHAEAGVHSNDLARHPDQQ